MKQNIHHLYYLFYPRRWIIIALLFCNEVILAQEQTPPEEFVIGAGLDRYTRHDQYYYDMFRESGMNLLHQYADGISHGLFQGLNFVAYNSEFPEDRIYYYSTSFYSKWEAEEDQTYRYKVGFKHREMVEGQDTLGNLIGSAATYIDRQCWSTEGLTAPACSLIYGPHYTQEKVYKRWYDGYRRWDLFYTPRFIMALDTLEYISPNDTICRLSVVARYRKMEDGQFVGGDKDTLLKSITLKASDFQPYGTFDTYYLDDGILWYQYPIEFRDPEAIPYRDYSQYTGIYFFDKWGDQGVQFRVDWLGDNSKCNLYIDYVEVYDNDGGQHFADQPSLVASRVVDYAEDFPQSDWSNMKYWGGCVEPFSLDYYIPLKTVDSLLDSIGAPRLNTTFYPYWEVTVNGDTQLVRYYNTVEPAKLTIDFFPFLDFRDPAGFEDWETTRKMLQICSNLQPGFWYQAQAAGHFINGNWYVVRRPSVAEFKAQNMLNI